MAVVPPVPFLQRLPGTRGIAVVVIALAALLPVRAQADARVQIVPAPASVVIEAVPVGEGVRATSDGLRYLLVDDQADLTGARPVWTRTIAYQVTRDRALSDAGRFTIDFQPAFQTARLHAVDVERDGQVESRLGQVGIEVLRREADLGSAMLDGRLTAHLTVPDLRVGDRLLFRYSVVGDNPIFGGAHYERFAGTYAVAVAKRTLRYRFDAALPLRWRVTGQPYDTRESREGGVRTVAMVAENLRAVRQEDEVPESYDPTGTLEFTTARDWKDVVAWAGPLYPRRFGDRAVAADLAKRLQLDAADPRGALARATAFVQGDIRYTAIDLGTNSHAPNPPELTLRRRFGDCKDKSALLVALLAEAGIDAEPVLVNTRARGTIRERMPSAAAFDHVVVRARMPGGDVWVDGTWPRETGPLASRPPLPYEVGLPVYTGDALVDIPYPMPTLPQLQVDEHVLLSTTGTQYEAAFGVVTTYRQGGAARIRDMFDTDGAEVVGGNYLAYMQGFHPGITLTAEPTFEEADGADEGVTTEYYRLRRDTADGDDLEITLFQLADWMRAPTDAPRRDPRALSSPRHAVQTIRVTHDGGWSIAATTDVIGNPHFRFERAVRVEGRDLVIVGTWTRLSREVPAADDAQYRKDLAAAAELLYFPLDVDGESLPEMMGTVEDRAWPLAAFAGVILVLVLAFRWRDRSAVAGMLYAPRVTVARLHASPLRWTLPLALLVLAGLAETSITIEQPLALQWSAEGFPSLVAGWVKWGFRSAAFLLLLQWMLLLLRVRVAWTRLLHVFSLAGVAGIVFNVAGLVAARGQSQWLADDHVPGAGTLGGTLMCALLLVVGACWMLVSFVNGAATAAATSRRRLVAAMALSLCVLLVFFLLLHLSKSA